MDLIPISFIDEPIEAGFDSPPLLEKKPPCPQYFIWRGQAYTVAECLAEWVDNRRRGRMARNMRPEHAERAQRVGSWGVGRYFFRVRSADQRAFEIYYDRAPQDASDRKGKWFLRAELRLPA